MKKQVLVTGATGNVGFETIKSLLRIDHDLEIVAGVRDVEKEKARFKGMDIKVIPFDFERQDGFGQALYGISILFLLRPPQISDAKKFFQPLVDAAKTAKIEHIVFLSVQGADKNKAIPHYKIEQIILKSGIPFTFLRPAYFMQNFLTTLKKDLVEKNEIYLPAGKAKFTIVDLIDVGEVGARILSKPEMHINQAYDLTNQELLTFGEMAGQLTEVLGKKITFRSPNLVSFYIRKRREGTPAVFILVMVMLHFFPRFQRPSKNSEAIENILAKKPTTFRQFVSRESGSFR
ncbi:NmrA family NAD(P)-binding protein [Aquiflexum sp. TKW24L]|uniref:NmrA family NAD(P)-binding protein n=1 Tax=Aquiflexum sp. TKW24L TaxID=2942212 RepID=UPI0020C086F5|nr:NmrA family NAD(P)-binding protein [Aquiflexum sp. TKW24L]MCL6258850.1 NmrA family NAD(P)-binding protein [Aquiflexum sp. TKW24L]